MQLMALNPTVDILLEVKEQLGLFRHGSAQQCVL
jgi:hypothetical protein